MSEDDTRRSRREVSEPPGGPDALIRFGCLLMLTPVMLLLLLIAVSTVRALLT